MKSENSGSETFFYVAGGTLRRDAPSYVPRKADDDLYEALCQGKFCYVLTSRQMGKSSLMVRTAVRLRSDGAAVAVLDLTRIGQNLTPEQWYDGLLTQIGRQLGIEDEVEAFWFEHERLSPLQRWMRVISEIILPKYTGRVIIFVDEIDAVRSLPFSSDEFFAGIREFYNRRTEEPDLERLTFCLVGVATPSDLIRDTRTTPFNIGKRIELHDFSEVEAVQLTRGLGRDERLGRLLLSRILYWTNGHPYLTQRLCQDVADDQAINSTQSLDRACASLFLASRSRERDDNLLFVRERILRSEADLAGLLELYLQVWRGKKVRDDETNLLVNILQLSGLTRADQGYLKVRNHIYERVFDQDWVQANMPDAEVQRQRAAYRRGVTRTTAIAGLVSAILTALLIFALGQRNYALANERIAKEALGKMEAALAEAKLERAAADTQRQLADRERKTAEYQRSVAEAQRAKAQRQEQLAREQTRIANQQTQLAKDAQATTNRYLYNTNLNLAQQLWERNKIGRMLSILDAQVPSKNEPDLRGFEWHYLWNLSHRDKATLRGYSTGLAFLIYSTDGKRLISADKKGGIRILDIEQRRELDSIPSISKEIRALAVSRDNRLLAVATEGRSVQLVDLASKQWSKPLIGHQEEITSVSFSPNGKWLASASDDKTVKLWDTKSGNELATLIGHAGPVLTLAFSPDNRKLLTGSSDGTSKIWELAAKTPPEVLPDSGAVYAAAFSVDSKLLAAVNRADELMVWDAKTKKVISRQPIDSGEINQVAFSPDGKLIATANKDSSIELYDLNSSDEAQQAFESINGRATSRDLFVTYAGRGHKKIATILKGHIGAAVCVAFSPDSNTLVSGEEDGTLKIWDIKKAKTGDVITEAANIQFLSTSRSGKMLAISRNGGIEVLDLTAKGSIINLEKEGDSIVPIAFSPSNEDLLAVAGLNGRRPKFLLSSTQGEIKDTDDDALPAIARLQGKIGIWNVHTKQLESTKDYQGSIASLCFSQDGQFLAVYGFTDSGRGRIEVLDVNARLTVRNSLELDENVKLLAFSFDAQLAVLLRDEKIVELLNVTTHSIKILKVQGETIRAAVFSPDAQWVAALSHAGVLKIWNVLADEERLPFEAQDDVITGIKFLRFQDQERISLRLLATDNKGNLRILDPSTWQETVSINTRSAAVDDLTITPDGSMIFVAGNDGRVRILSTIDQSRVSAGHYDKSKSAAIVNAQH